MCTGEKRCNECDWEFYEGEDGEIELEDGTFKDGECCPECGSPDWEYKLTGTDEGE